MNNIARFHGGLTALVYNLFEQQGVLQFDVRFSTYQGFHLIDIQWDVDGRRYSYRQALTFLEVQQVLGGALSWESLVRRIGELIEVSIKERESLSVK